MKLLADRTSGMDLVYVEQDRKQAEYWLRRAMESTKPDAVAEAQKELATEVL